MAKKPTLKLDERMDSALRATIKTIESMPKDHFYKTGAVQGLLEHMSESPQFTEEQKAMLKQVLGLWRTN